MNSLIKKLLTPRSMEYLLLDEGLIIQEMSFGAKRFAESPHMVEVWQDARLGFPELIGSEYVLKQILWGWSHSLELKGIARFTDAEAPLYVDLLVVADRESGETDNQLVIFFEDVTERMLLEQSLAQRSHEAHLLLASLTTTKNNLEKIIGSMADPLIVTNMVGKIKTVNPAAENLFGYSQTELLEQSISLIIPSSEVLSILNQTDLNQTDSKQIEVRCYSKSGIEILVSFSCSVVQTEIPGLHDYVYIGRDVTVRAQIEANLEAARISAEQASQTKSLFLANMSHEIRTPMNGVLGLTELLLGTNLDNEQRDFVESIKLSGDALLILINEILDLSKLESGEMQLESYDFDLITSIEEVADLLAPQAHAKGLELVNSIDPQIPIRVKGDALRLRQILINLLNNAIKFTNRGEILIQIDLLLQTDSIDSVKFSIIDTGIGIPLQSQNKLFAPFSQVDASTSRKFGGTGLGLAICKQLVILMGGEIGVESTPNQGSKFWMSIPFSKVKTLPAIVCPNLTNYRLLIVEDNISIRQVIHTYIGLWGMHVDEAASAATALQLLETNFAQGLRYDLAIIDLQMHDVNGIALAEQIKAHPIFHDLTLIMLVSTKQIAIARHAQTLGFADYLIKPIRFSRLLETIENILGIHLHIDAYESSANQQLASEPRPLRILLAEDNLINQKVANKFLSSLGYEPEMAMNGQEVLHLLANNTYDLIFMDCQMPILDGYATTKEIRRREGSKHHTIIVAMTASAMKEDRDKCLAAGMDDYLSKPFSKKQIENIIAKWSN